MSTTRKAPPAPRGLGSRARAFWRDVHRQYDFDLDELQLLTEVVRTIDALDELRAIVAREGHLSTGSTGQTVEHPAAVATRQHRIVLARLLKQLDLPALDEDSVAAPSSASRAASHAARARWGRRHGA